MQMLLFGLACALVSAGAALAFAAALIGPRARRVAAVCSGVTTVAGVGALVAAAMTVG